MVIFHSYVDFPGVVVASPQGPAELAPSNVALPGPERFLPADFFAGQETASSSSCEEEDDASSDSKAEDKESEKDSKEGEGDEEEDSEYSDSSDGGDDESSQ
eukprot:s2572_g7.t1